MENHINLSLSIFALICFVSMVDGFCRKAPSCEDKAKGIKYKAGEHYKTNCMECTCSERRNKVITCYRNNDGIFKTSGRFYDFRHYYIDITPEEAKTVQCPLGMKKVTPNLNAVSQFYITYVEVKKESVCCRLIARPLEKHRLCKTHFEQNSCEFKLVLKTNQGIDCPFVKTEKHVHHRDHHHGHDDHDVYTEH